VTVAASIAVGQSQRFHVIQPVGFRIAKLIMVVGPYPIIFLEV
jgi:hypothetical protein